MTNGLQKISLPFFLILFFFTIGKVFAEDIQLGPLINLDQIEPSYESLDGELGEDNIVSGDIENNMLTPTMKIRRFEIEARFKEAASTLNKQEKILWCK